MWESSQTTFIGWKKPFQNILCGMEQIRQSINAEVEGFCARETWAQVLALLPVFSQVTILFSAFLSSVLKEE